MYREIRKKLQFLQAKNVESLEWQCSENNIEHFWKKAKNLDTIQNYSEHFTICFTFQK